MNAISSPVQSVLDLFASELSDVRFGDVDARTLTSAAAEVQKHAEALASAEALLAGARDALHEQQELLLQHAQRALAYARVYAETNVELRARLDAITLPRASRRLRPDALEPDPPATPRPRGRPRKVVGDASLTLAGTGDLR